MKFKLLKLLVVMISGCGGGGGTPPSETQNNTPTPTVMKAKLYDTSYKNFKLNGVDSIIYPHNDLRWGGNYEGVAYGDFLKEGELSVAVAHENYAWGIGFTAYAEILNNPSEYSSEIRIYKINEDHSSISLRLAVAVKVRGCLHARKLLAADFNKDGIPDIFMVCHGYDNDPYPGEKNMIMMSVARGQYTVSKVGEVAFHHGASAADVNNDSYPDVVVADGLNVYFYMNQKDGTFTKDISSIYALNLPYYNAELIDLDKDGIIDIVSGGHEFSGAVTTIFYGNADGTFGSRTKSIPAILGWGIVQDFTLIGSKLIVDRTGDSTGGGMNNGYMIQSVNLITNQSEILGSVTSTAKMWMLPKTRDGVVGVGPFDTTDFYPL